MQPESSSIAVDTKSPSHWQVSIPLALLACLVSAAAGEALAHLLYPSFPYAKLPEVGYNPTPELAAKHRAAEHDFQSLNAAVTYAILGGCFGLLVGALTANGKNLRAALAGGIGGTLAGAVTGYLVGHLVADAILSNTPKSMGWTVLVHFLIWGQIAAVSFAAIASMYGRQHILKALIIGEIGGLVASLLYNLAASNVFPMDNLVLLMPETTEHRYLWAFSLILVLGASLIIGFRGKATKPAGAGVA